MFEKNNLVVIQGSFPGGRPHSSVLLNAGQGYSSHTESMQVVQALFRHPNNLICQQKQASFKRENLAMQCYSANNKVNVYPLNISRLNLQNEGYSIEGNLLQLYESAFNKDLHDVKIHTGSGEAETLGALAFTTGNDIYFATGRYNPYTQQGQKLLGHELTHVIQQKEGRIGNANGNGAVVVHDPRLEAEAERMGTIMTSVFKKKIHLQIGGHRSLIQLVQKSKGAQIKDNNVYDLTIQFIKDGDVNSVKSSMAMMNIEDFEAYYSQKYTGEAQGKLWLLALINSGEAKDDCELIRLCSEYMRTRYQGDENAINQYIKMNYSAKHINDIAIYKYLVGLYETPPDLVEIKKRLQAAYTATQSRLSEILDKAIDTNSATEKQRICAKCFVTLYKIS